jgi:hypothetical protein
MSIAAKVAELLVAIRRQDLDELSPAERRRLADLCRHVAGFAEEEDDTPGPSDVPRELPAVHRAE